MLGFPQRTTPPDVAAGLDGYGLVADLVGHLALDSAGIVGVVDEIRPDGSIRIRCGWFGTRDIVVQWNAVKQVRHGERELVLHDAHPAVTALRPGGGAYARIVARLGGRSADIPHAPT